MFPSVTEWNGRDVWEGGDFLSDESTPTTQGGYGRWKCVYVREYESVRVRERAG
eukprot:gnl/Chilomastix_caulleri/2360.p2 GENE.gnl/Chilomastix_caulleri/2360~~gnl/Chilomastix_caulleri/2360.p2  ORF type:complete len:54 (+),score=20.61 gnl/Chilomastix_caulleri/2360:149-310(+)